MLQYYIRIRQNTQCNSLTESLCSRFEISTRSEFVLNGIDEFSTWLDIVSVSYNGGKVKNDNNNERFWLGLKPGVQHLANCVSTQENATATATTMHPRRRREQQLLFLLDLSGRCRQM